MIARGRLAAGAVVLIACGQYLVAEAVTASAWTIPYSYSRNYISDLGVTACVPRGPCSPWGTVMNAGFVISGVLAVAAALLLAPLIRGRALRWSVLGLALTHAAGSMIVGVVHSAPSTPTGTPRLHVIGAYLAILGGNLALITVGAGLQRGGAVFRRFSILMGLLGLGSALMLLMTRRLPPGLLERGAVDTITLWEIMAGVLMAVALVRRRPAAGPAVA